MKVHPATGILLFAIAAILMLAFAVLIAPFVPPLIDFDQTFYPAIRYTLAGINPYTADYSYSLTSAAPGQTPPAFFSPFWLLFILFPFGLLPLAVARALWALFLIAITLMAINRLQAWGLRGLWPLALTALPWSLISILYGQVTPLVLLGTLVSVLAVAREDGDIRGRIALVSGLLLVGLKPQLGLSIGLPLLLWLVWRGDRRVVMLSGIGILLVIVTLIITPPTDIAELAVTLRGLAPHWTSTLGRELHWLALPAWLAWLIRIFAIAIMIRWAWQTRTLTPSWWSAWLAVTLIITPYTRAYDGVLLLPLLGQLMARHWPRALLFVAGIVAYVVVIHGEAGSVVTPLLAWLLFVPWRRLMTSSTEQRPSPTTLFGD